MKIMNPKYIAMQYPTPHDFKNTYPNSDILILGTGVSTQRTLEFKNKLKTKFDAIIGVNLSIKDFENEMDFHVISEKGILGLFINEDTDGKKIYRKDLKRVFNWKIIDKYPKDMSFVKSNRNDFDGNFNIREYKFNNTEGLLAGPKTKADNLAAGTVILQSVHLACILGAKNIYLSGADFLFSQDYDHYYKDRLYRDTKRDWQTKIITVEHNGEKRQTLQYFKESADHLNKIITILKQQNINIYSFSDGLLSNASIVNIYDFMG